MRQPRVLGVITCADCGAETPCTSGAQRYCKPCSAARDTLRKAEWARRNGHNVDPERRGTQARRRLSETRAAGQQRSLNARAGIAWPADLVHPDAHTVRRVAVPFSYAASKNATWRHGRGGHVYATAEARSYREMVALALRTGDRWYQAKLWVDIFVEKPDHKGDAANVVDMVFDAVQDATGVNDKWYSLLRLDWSIVKVEPKLYVGIRQEATQDHIVCGNCGIAHPARAEFFHRNRSSRTGFSHACRECISARRRGKAIPA